MARTEPGGSQIKDGSLQRRDMDITTVGQAMIVQVAPGVGISMVSTGADAGTGVVTITATGAGASFVGVEKWKTGA